MLRGAKQNHPSSGHAAFGTAGRSLENIHHATAPRQRERALERPTGASKVLGFCGWALSGGVALFAIWEIGNFSVLVGNAPLLPGARHEATPPALYRPAGGSMDADGGCTQAPIDRSTGQTTPADCHTRAPGGGETMLAALDLRAAP